MSLTVCVNDGIYRFQWTSKGALIFSAKQGTPKQSEIDVVIPRGALILQFKSIFYVPQKHKNVCFSSKRRGSREMHHISEIVHYRSVDFLVYNIPDNMIFL